jgi:hypothetical protein
VHDARDDAVLLQLAELLRQHPLGDAINRALQVGKAVVIDEHRKHRGRDAIARWKAEATAKYHYTSEPLTVDVSGADVVVTARLTGDFPGSPVKLRYCFALEGDEIARLEITA